VSPSLADWSAALWRARLQLAFEPRPPEDAERPWEGALEELRRKLAAQRARVDVTLVLSNHFVRYVVLPAQDGVASLEEEAALARFHFTRIHGERVKSWDVRVSDGLACAIDAALLAGIKEAFTKHKSARLASVQPALMAFYNRSRRRIPREGAWLLLAEQGRTCLARLAAHGWASVHNGHETDAEALIERERNRASGEPLPALVLKSPHGIPS
jgi:hypothetical protein